MTNILQTIKRNPEGYLLNLTDWNSDVANAIAAEDGINLTQEHWEIINILREFHANYNASPTVKVLVNILRSKENCYLISPPLREDNLVSAKQSSNNASFCMASLQNLTQNEDKSSYENSTHKDSVYLLKLFPAGPAKQANKIAGLPKPVHCI